MAQLRRLRDNIITAYSLSGCSSKEIQTLLRVEHGQSLRLDHMVRVSLAQPDPRGPSCARLGKADS